MQTDMQKEVAIIDTDKASGWVNTRVHEGCGGRTCKCALPVYSFNGQLLVVTSIPKDPNLWVLGPVHRTPVVPPARA